MAKTLVEWCRTDKAVVLKGAVSDGEFFDGKGVQALAKLPVNWQERIVEDT